MEVLKEEELSEAINKTSFGPNSKDKDQKSSTSTNSQSSLSYWAHVDNLLVYHLFEHIPGKENHNCNRSSLTKDKPSFMDARSWQVSHNKT